MQYCSYDLARRGARRRSRLATAIAATLAVGLTAGVSSTTAAQDAATRPSSAAAAAPAPAPKESCKSDPLYDTVQDAKLDAWKAELLDLAFTAASKFPLNPHHKNRARAQEVVVEASLELDQPRRALDQTDQVLGWTKGFCWANVAFQLAKHGDKVVAPKLLERAVQVGDDVTSGADFQDWQRDRIRVKVAEARLLLGEAAEAASITANVDPSESGKVETVKAELADASTFDQELADVDRMLAAKNFAVTRNTLERCAKLYDRFYGDADKRGKVEDRMRDARKSCPLQASLDVATEFAQVALAHGDAAKTLLLVSESVALLDGAKWLTEDYVPLRMKLVPLLWKAGKEDEARADVKSALARFESERPKIANIYRARVLRSIAEAFATAGDNTSAIAMYQRAVEAGVENPNSRPRTDDLVATCCSLARHSVEPTAALHARLVEIVAKLGDPW